MRTQFRFNVLLDQRPVAFPAGGLDVAVLRLPMGQKLFYRQSAAAKLLFAVLLPADGQLLANVGVGCSVNRAVEGPTVRLSVRDIPALPAPILALIDIFPSSGHRHSSCDHDFDGSCIQQKGSHLPNCIKSSAFPFLCCPLNCDSVQKLTIWDKFN